MTYGVTVDGFVKKTFAIILEEIEDYLTENLSRDLTRDRLSVIGHLNTNATQELSELWEVAQAIYSNQYRDGASGINLQYIAALTGSYLSAYTKTTVTGTVTLNPNTTLPVGSVANLGGQPSVRFVTLTEVVATAGGGDYDVEFEAETEGAIQVSIGQMNEIAEPQAGWLSVTNADPGSTGTEPETDPAFRLKIAAELAARGSTNVDAIRSSIIRDTDCTSCRVAENDTDIIDENLIPPHTIWVICKDGDNQDIADVIFETKAAGIRTKGTEIETVTDIQGEDHEIRFSYATEVEVDVQVSFNLAEGYILNDVRDAIETVVQDYFDALGVGDNVIFYDIVCIIKDVDGIESIIDITVDLDTSDIVIDFDEIAVLGAVEWAG